MRGWRGVRARDRPHRDAANAPTLRRSSRAVVAIPNGYDPGLFLSAHRSSAPLAWGGGPPLLYFGRFTGSSAAAPIEAYAAARDRSHSRSGSSRRPASRRVGGRSPRTPVRASDFEDVYFAGWHEHRELPDLLAARRHRAPSVRSPVSSGTVEAMAGGLPAIAVALRRPHRQPGLTAGWSEPDTRSARGALVRQSPPAERLRRARRRRADVASGCLARLVERVAELYTHNVRSGATSPADCCVWPTVVWSGILGGPHGPCYLVAPSLAREGRVPPNPLTCPCLLPSAESASTTPSYEHERLRFAMSQARLHPSHETVHGRSWRWRTSSTRAGGRRSNTARRGMLLLSSRTISCAAGTRTSPTRLRRVRVLPPAGAERRAEPERLLTETVEAEGQRVVGWRDVPSTRLRRQSPQPLPPYVKQLLVAASMSSRRQDSFGRKLYVIPGAENRRAALTRDPVFSSRRWSTGI